MLYSTQRKPSPSFAPATGPALLLGCLIFLLTIPVRAAEHAIILQYHHVSEHTPPATSITPRQFARHLDHLKQHNYHIWPLQRIVRHLRERRALPDKTVALTFDDGYRNIYQHAYPLLKARNWPFTIFINAPDIDSGQLPFLTWPQLQEMARAGAAIANHTLSHPHMIRQAPHETATQRFDRLRHEIEANERLIRQHTGQRHRMLAYPYGEYDPAVQSLVRKLDFVAFGQQSGPAGFLSDLQALPRFPASGPYADLDSLKVKLESLPLPLSATTPTSSVLAPAQHKPRLRLTLAPGDYQLDQLACYASGQGRVPHRMLQQQPAIIEVSPHRALSPGRSRYNCTAPHHTQTRYYWFSHPWFKPHADGRWYDE